MSWFTDKSRCYHGGQRHFFMARYTEQQRGTSCKIEGHLTADAMHSLMTLDVYVHDICIWCGKIIAPVRAQKEDWNVTVTKAPSEPTRAKDPSDPVRASDPSDPTHAQNPKDSPA